MLHKLFHSVNKGWEYVVADPGYFSACKPVEGIHNSFDLLHIKLCWHTPTLHLFSCQSPPPPPPHTLFTILCRFLSLNHSPLALEITRLLHCAAARLTQPVPLLCSFVEETPFPSFPFAPPWSGGLSLTFGGAVSRRPDLHTHTVCLSWVFFSPPACR